MKHRRRGDDTPAEWRRRREENAEWRMQISIALGAEVFSLSQHQPRGLGGGRTDGDVREASDD
eukprot:1220372-Prymnesium_polylepis.1